MNDVYIDSRGAEMEAISFSEALELVHDLATGNQIDENDIAFGDAGLSAQRVWQQAALDTLGDFVVNHSDSVDELAPSAQAQDWPDDLLQADRSVDPNQVINAIKICLSLAEQAALDPQEAGREVELADEVDRQQQAFDLVRDLIGLHGAELQKVSSLDISSVFDRR